MKAVHRYRLKGDWEETVRLPRGAKVLTVQARFDAHLDLWAMVDADLEQEDRVFMTVPTGARLDDRRAETLRWVGTVQLDGGVHVLHVFEVAPGHNKQPPG